MLFNEDCLVHLSKKKFWFKTQELFRRNLYFSDFLLEIFMILDMC